jgi:hypothetical protein
MSEVESINAIPGQGNANPKALFAGPGWGFQGAPNPPAGDGVHELVLVSGQNIVLDPSYGLMFNGGTVAQAEQKWQDAALKDWHYRLYIPVALANAAGVAPVSDPKGKPHQAGQSEVTFSGPPQ